MKCGKNIVIILCVVIFPAIIFNHFLSTSQAWGVDPSY
jgi:hypothetical protein